MASVAFPTTTATPTGLADSTSTTTGTATASTDLFAALFQSILAEAIAQANVTPLQAAFASVDPQAVLAGAQQTPTAAPAIAALAAQLQAALASAKGEPQAGIDVLAQLFASTDKTGTTADTVVPADAAAADGKTADVTVNANLLSQLLAALGTNAAPPPQQPVTQVAAPATASPTATVPAIPATVAPAVQQVLDHAPAFQLLTKQSPTQQPTPITPTTELPITDTKLIAPKPAAPAVSVSVVVPNQTDPKATQPITVSAANRVAARTPVVVPQTPVIADASQALPPGPITVPANAVQLPVAEVSATKAPAPVGVELLIPRTPTEEPPKPATPTVAPVAFTLPAPTAQPTPGIAATPAAPTAVEPAPARAAAVLTTATFSAPALPSQAQSAATTSTTEFTKLLAASLTPQAAPDDDSNDVPVTAAPQPPRFETVSAQPVDRPAAPAPVAPTVADQLTGPIVAALRPRPADGETEMRIRLDPPELGTVKLKIVSTGGEVRAELHVSSDAVRRVVESQLPELQQKLDDAGVKVQRFDVTADPNGGTSGDTANGERSRWQMPDAPEPPPAYRPIRPAAAKPVTNRIDLSA